MANAAAKKAEAARQAASTSYLPIIIAINAGYLFLRLIYQRNLLSVTHLLATLFFVVLSFISYKGILEDHANTIPKGKSSTSSGAEALAGGASLDLLGLVSVVQYGSVLLSTKIYWLLVLIPIWGGWKLYSIMKGGLGGLFPNKASTMPTTNESDNVNDDNAEKSNARKQKRAEKRRQKWS
ncbi:hypothetical protein ACHAWU_000878 [Discostella pseudostelligera]|uniref:Transmembrane protein 208 n=1 Tax=Discostella pseudostelligera TaxID=259834 RepID=A0ABD3M6B8_9STRA